MHIYGNTVRDGTFTRKTEWMGNLGRLGKKWIENRSIAKYPHSTGVCSASSGNAPPFQAYTLLDLYGGRIDVRFANTSGSQNYIAKSQLQVGQTIGWVKRMLRLEALEPRQLMAGDFHNAHRRGGRER